MIEDQEAADGKVQFACAVLLAATVLFNPLLALAAAQGAPVNGNVVASVQGLIVGAALLIGALQPRRPPWRWIALTWALVAAAALTGSLRAQLDTKSLGDVLLIPAFIMLGTRLTTRTLVPTLIGIQVMVVAVALWEISNPQQFGAIFKVAQYYVRTRGFSADAFWAGRDLFLSSERPHGRLLLPGSGLHRGSSLFLEPVSLGNWTVVTTIATAMLWPRLASLARAGIIVSTLFLLVVCDGRLSLIVCGLLAAYLPPARRLPEWTSVLYLPALLILIALAAHVGLLDVSGDTFAGRLRFAVDAFNRLDLERLLAISDERRGLEDAGFAYIILRQSIVVAIGLWLVITLTSLGDDRTARICKHGIALFLVLCLPISNALLSIKTASLMWACYGYCQARAARSRRPTTNDAGTRQDWALAHG